MPLSTHDKGPAVYRKPGPAGMPVALPFLQAGGSWMPGADARVRCAAACRIPGFFILRLDMNQAGIFCMDQCSKEIM